MVVNAKWFGMLFGLLLLVAFTAGAVSAQEPPGPPPEMEGGPMMGPGGPGGPGMGDGPGMGPGRPGMGPRGPGGPGGRGGKFPVDREKIKKMQALQASAEAYKSLAESYQEQGKVDEAIVQYREILKLSEAVEDKEDRTRLANKLSRVYMEMGEIYMNNNRLEDAQKVLQEGVDKMKKDSPEDASRLLLHLGKVLQKAKKTEEANKVFKQVIELNAPLIKDAKK